MTEIKIEKGIPIPEGRLGATVKYPYKDMEVGDSFYIADYRKGRSSEAAMRQFIKLNKLNWKIRTKREDTGLRIWRAE